MATGDKVDFVQEGQDNRMSILLADATAELDRARSMYPKFNSLHEAYATLWEEFEEVWEEIRKKPSARDLAKIYEESVQLIAMAMRLVLDCDITPTSDDLSTQTQKEIAARNIAVNAGMANNQQFGRWAYALIRRMTTLENSIATMKEKGAKSVKGS